MCTGRDRHHRRLEEKDALLELADRWEVERKGGSLAIKTGTLCRMMKSVEECIGKVILLKNEEMGQIPFVKTFWTDGIII